MLTQRRDVEDSSTLTSPPYIHEKTPVISLPGAVCALLGAALALPRHATPKARASQQEPARASQQEPRELFIALYTIALRHLNAGGQAAARTTDPATGLQRRGGARRGRLRDSRSVVQSSGAPHLIGRAARGCTTLHDGAHARLSTGESPAPSRAEECSASSARFQQMHRRFHHPLAHLFPIVLTTTK